MANGQGSSWIQGLKGNTVLEKVCLVLLLSSSPTQYSISALNAFQAGRTQPTGSRVPLANKLASDSLLSVS